MNVSSRRRSDSGCVDDSVEHDAQCHLKYKTDTADAAVCAPLIMHNVVENLELLRWVDGFSFGPGKKNCKQTNKQ